MARAIPPVCFLGVVTTGPRLGRDRIAHAAAIRVESGACERWQGALHAQMTLDELPEEGGTEAFARLHALAGGSVLVARSPRRAYAFLKDEARRKGMALRARPLSLEALAAELGIQPPVQAPPLARPPHALHDPLREAQALHDAWELLRAQAGPQAFHGAVRMLLARPAPQLQQGQDLRALPETPGIYVLYGEDGMPLYVGKSVRLRSRVRAHFSGDHASAKELRLSQQARHVEVIETAGELGALLREARLVKELMPLHNRLLRRHRRLCALALAHDARGYARLSVSEGIDASRLGDVYGLFRSKGAALAALERLAREHGVCPAMLGLDKRKGACFSRLLGACAGACAGEQSAQEHNTLLAHALGPLRTARWPYPGRIGVRERREGREEIHVVDRWCYLGTVACEDAILSLEGEDAPFDVDAYRILTSFLTSRKGIEIVDPHGKLHARKRNLFLPSAHRAVR